MITYLWATGGLTGAGIAVLIGIFLYLTLTEGGAGSGVLAWALIGGYLMIATAFFAIAHAIGWLVRWLM